MGDLRDRFDIAAAIADHRRAGHAGGPKRFVRAPTGRPRGADRFPAKRVRRGKR